jgi:multidrug efflux pump subunit AcrB
MTGLGVLTLAGLVVNNAIVLIDCIIHKRQSGMSAIDAAVSGARQRLRPVLLTAVTTVLGLIPMAIGLNIEIHTFPWKIVSGAESGEWWAPMAVAVIYGLSMATILTMVVVPVMYVMAESGADRLRRVFNKTSGNA